MMTSVISVIESTLDDRGLEWDSTGEGSFVVTLPGSHKLKTLCNLRPAVASRVDKEDRSQQPA